MKYIYERFLKRLVYDEFKDYKPEEVKDFASFNVVLESKRLKSMNYIYDEVHKELHLYNFERNESEFLIECAYMLSVHIHELKPRIDVYHCFSKFLKRFIIYGLIKKDTVKDYMDKYSIQHFNDEIYAYIDQFLLDISDLNISINNSFLEKDICFQVIDGYRSKNELKANQYTYEPFVQRWIKIVSQDNQQEEISFLKRLNLADQNLFIHSLNDFTIDVYSEISVKSPYGYKIDNKIMKNHGYKFIYGEWKWMKIVPENTCEVEINEIKNLYPKSNVSVVNHIK